MAEDRDAGDAFVRAASDRGWSSDGETAGTERFSVRLRRFGRRMEVSGFRSTGSDSCAIAALRLASDLVSIGRETGLPVTLVVGRGDLALLSAAAGCGMAVYGRCGGGDMMADAGDRS